MPAPTPAPTIVVPDIAPPLAEPFIPESPAPAAEPEADPVPAPSRAETPPAAREQAVAPREVSGEAPAAVEAASEPVPAGAEPVVPPPMAGEQVVLAPEFAVDDGAQPSGEAPLGLIAGVLAAIGVIALAIWGFVAIGRRSRPKRAAAPVVERPVMAAASPTPPRTAPVGTVTPLATPRPAASSLAHSGAAVSLPRELPATFAEREALFRRMVDAAPDRANPFASRKARTKRARLILQSLGRDFGEVEPWIDLSQYPQNWPELARRNRAAA